MGPSCHLVPLVQPGTWGLHGALPGSGALPPCVTASTRVPCGTVLVVVVSWDTPGLICLSHKLCSLAVVGNTGVQPKYSLCFSQGKFAARADFPAAAAKQPIFPRKAHLKPPGHVTGLCNLSCIGGVDTSMQIPGQMLSW